MNRKLRMGMIGGVHDGSIGLVHFMAACLDDSIELVAGVFSSTREKSDQSARKLRVDPARVYRYAEEMMTAEDGLPPDKRIDFVSIVTPNYLHYGAAKIALEHGYHVFCEKPVTNSLREARELARIVKTQGSIFALAHAYTGYPMVKEARFRIRQGQLGILRKVEVNYRQGWLSTRLEDTGHKQASWRTDPARAGIAGCMGDIGTHAANLAEYVTGLEIESVCAELSTFVQGRKLDDDGIVLLHFKGGAKGILNASQVSAGEENALSINVYGTLGGLEWQQQDPDTLVFKWPSGGREVLRKGSNYGSLNRGTTSASRMPSGHPEGVIEAFANLYAGFAYALRSRLGAAEDAEAATEFPTIYEGLRGMAFLESVVESSRFNQKWVKLP